MEPEPLGEFDRIRRFFAPLAGPGGLGLRDDAALIDCPTGHRIVATVDQAVEGVHFLSDDPPDSVAKKLLRRNLSDLAAMGARPRHYLLTTALPKSCGDDWLQRFAGGLAEDQDRFGIALVGGDSTATPGPATLTVTAFGEIAAGAELRRNGAKPGDRLWVSGTIGDAFLGLRVLRRDEALAGLGLPYEQALIGRYRVPDPRVELGLRLVGIAHAAIDISDGLVADLGHICAVSGVAARVVLDRIPISEAARVLVAEDASLHAALAAGGDDYELLFAVAPEQSGAIAQLSAALDLSIAEIGGIEPGSGVRLVGADGRPVPLASDGWRHF